MGELFGFCRVESRPPPPRPRRIPPCQLHNKVSGERGLGRCVKGGGVTQSGKILSFAVTQGNISDIAECQQEMREKEPRNFDLAD